MAFFETEHGEFATTHHHGKFTGIAFKSKIRSVTKEQEDELLCIFAAYYASMIEENKGIKK